MTAYSRGARRPKECDGDALEKRGGRRESRVPSAPAIVRTRCTRVTARCAGTPGLPCAMVLRLIARSSRSRIPLASVADELTIPRKPGRARKISASLTPATGARTTRLCRPRLPLPKPLDRLMCCRARFRRRRLSAGRLRAGWSLTGRSPPCDSVRARHCRVHRIPRPTSVTIAIRPSSGCGMAQGNSADLPDSASGIFLGERLDRNLVICLSGWFVAAICGNFRCA